MAINDNVPMTSNPAKLAAAVTLSDSADLTIKPCRALFVGVGGNVTAVLTNGDVVLFKNVPTGSILPISVNRVNTTGTAATDLVALY